MHHPAELWAAKATDIPPPPTPTTILLLSQAAILRFARKHYSTKRFPLFDWHLPLTFCWQATSSGRPVPDPRPERALTTCAHHP